MTHGNRLRRNTSTLLLSNMGSAALGFVLSVMVGRALGEDGLGIYATALAWIFPLSLLAEGGLGTLITRDVAQDERLSAGYVRAVTISRLVVGGGMTVLLLLAAPALSDSGPVVRGIMLSAPLVIVGPFFGTFTAVFRARQQMWPVAWLNLGMLAAQVVSTGILLNAGANILAVLAVNVITSAGQLFAAWLIYHKRFRGMSDQPAPDTLALMRRAWPFALAALLAALHTRTGIIFLERLSGTHETGYYAAAARFIEGGRMLPQAYFDALFPMLALLATQHDDFQRTFRRAIRLLALFGLIFAALMTLAGAALINLTYGTAFAPAAGVLTLSAWALLPGALKGGQTLYWYAQGKETFVNRVTAAALALRVAITIPLIAQHGAYGAAAANLAVEALSYLMLRIGPRA